MVARLGLTRVLLRAHGLGPIPYVIWLEELVRLKLIYGSSGGYVFIHQLVQEQTATTATHVPRPR